MFRERLRFNGFLRGTIVLFTAQLCGFLGVAVTMPTPPRDDVITLHGLCAGGGNLKGGSA